MNLISVYISFQFVRVPVKLLDEIERPLVVRAVPELNIDNLGLLFHGEFC